jgi:hypothetical protein
MGQTYGQKDIEFIKFIDLPRKLPNASFQIALAKVHHVRWQASEEYLGSAVSETDLSHETPHALLQRFGWRVMDAEATCGDFGSYRDFIVSSKAEWSVAKQGYVRGRTGWFSGRSACYLAAGRPVIVQDTGFSQVLPSGAGVLAYATAEEAIAAVEEVESSYPKHARAALDIAQEYFHSDTVLNKILSSA